MTQQLRLPITSGIELVIDQSLSPLTQTQCQSLANTVRSALNRATNENTNQPKHFEYTFTTLDSILAYRKKSQRPAPTSPIEPAGTSPATTNYDIPAFLRRLASHSVRHSHAA